MAHDVFISYSSKDKTVADAMCAHLERAAVRCWIAPRDIVPGTEWGGAIVDAIENARIMVLVFSENANQSPQIAREVERAVNKGLAIIPFRIEDVVPQRSLEYFLSTPHWLDAMSPPLEEHLNYLVDIIQHILTGQPPPQRAPQRSATYHRVSSQTLLIAGGAVVALLVAVFLLTRGGDNPPPTSAASTTAAGPVEKAMQGTWQVDVTRSHNYSGGLKKAVWQIDESGNYKQSMEFEERGRWNTINGGLELRSDAVSNQRVVKWDQKGDSVQALSLEVEGTLSLAATYSTQASNQIMNKFEWEWKRSPSGPANSPVGIWTREGNYSGQVWQYSIELMAGGRYVAKASTEDSGKFFAADSKWHLASVNGGVANGEYQFIDPNTVSLPMTRWGDMIWKR